MNTNYKLPRLLTVLAALMLAGAIFLPIWQVQLSAPQYPEGLVLKISAKGLSGDVAVVNGLNHYIGMHTLHNEDFVEFTLLPYILGVLILLGLIAAFVNKKKFYYGYIALFMFVAIISMVDFYRWEYSYGHNLDPNAPIQVPGMSYQPPLIGYKQLLNFGAYSIPDKGGWMFIGAGVLLFIAYLTILKPRWLTSKRNRAERDKLKGKKVVAVAAMVGMFALQGCSAKPLPIKYGSDACDFCKMTIMQKKFACEWITGKGKVYRFDDVHCMASFLKANKNAGIAYINSFDEKHEFVKAVDLFFVKSEELKSPMGGNVAAFADKGSADEFARVHSGKSLLWDEVEKEMAK